MDDMNKPNLLQRCGLVTPQGDVVGAEGPHPDAELLALIAQFSHLTEVSHRAIRRAELVKEGGAAYRRHWKEALSTHRERDQLERAICATKAKTTVGAIARMQLWMEVWGDKTGGTVWDLPHAAIRDAMVILEAGANRLPC